MPRPRKSKHAPTLAEQVKAARGDRSQAEVARAAARSPLAIRFGWSAESLQVRLCKIETGATLNPGVYTLAALADGLIIGLDRLIDGPVIRVQRSPMHAES